MAKSMKSVVNSFLKNSKVFRECSSPLFIGRKSVTPCLQCHIGFQISAVQNQKISTSVIALKKISKITSSEFLENRNSLGLCDKRFGSYEKISPRQVSEKLKVEDAIKRPEYCYRTDGAPSKPVSKKPLIKNKEEIDYMRESCRLAKFVLQRTLLEAKPGVSTDDLDKFAHELIISSGAYPSALGYRNFPKSICTSVNNVACHGIPDDRKLISGDLISVDVMVYKNGFHGDCAGTSMIGSVDELGKKLVRVAEECTNIGISECGPGKPFDKIGKAIEAHANAQGFSVIPTFTGHGVGRSIHEQPDIYHYDRTGSQSDVMKPGMIFTVEPVITQGMELIMLLSDGWTAITVDGGRTAQFEHTLLITSDGVEILTDCIFIGIL